MVNFNIINVEDKMTKLERVNAALNFKETDRVPLSDILLNSEAIEYFSETKLEKPEYKKSNLSIAGKAIKNSLDIVRGLCIPNKPGVNIRGMGFQVKSIAWTEWIEKRPFTDLKMAKNFVAEIIKEVSKLKPEFNFTYYGEKISIKDYKKNFLETQKLVGDTVLFHESSPVGLNTIEVMLGMEKLSYLYYEEPELISECLEELCNHEVDKIHFIADNKLSPAALAVNDLAYKNSLIYSPEFLKKEFFPRLTRIVSAWHEYEIKCIFHSDGNFMSVLEDFIKAGVDGIHPIEPLAGWDLIDVRKKYSNLVLMGNIDVSQLLPFGSKLEVMKAVKKAIDDIYPGSGLLLGSSTELGSALKLENIIIMNLFAKEYSRISPFKIREIDEIKI